MEKLLPVGKFLPDIGLQANHSVKPRDIDERGDVCFFCFGQGGKCLFCSSCMLCNVVEFTSPC